MLCARIAATGVSLPPNRIADVSAVELGARAARQALGDGPPPDLLLWTAAAARQAIPDTGVFLSRELGFDRIPTFTVHATCLSLLVGLRLAAMHVATGAARRVLVVSGERGTRGVADPEGVAMLGDGGAAVIVEPADDGGLLAFRMETWPAGAELSEVRGGGEREPLDDTAFRMNARALYKFARRRLEPVLFGAIADAGLTPADIRLVIPHQASRATMAAWGHVGFGPDRVIDVFDRTGNCVSASIGHALHEALTSGRAAKGDTVLVFGTGAGVSAAAAVWRL